MNDEIKEIENSDLMELLETTSKKEFYRLTIDHELVVRLYNWITNLQKEVRINNDVIPYLKNKEKSLKKQITILQKENQRLKNLCDKYEEEHNTTFKLWKMKMEEMPTYEEKIEMQKENQRLKEELKNRPIVDFTFDTYKELEDYKSRCEKAIEYVKEHTENIDRGRYYEDYVETYDLLNILNGGDEE